MITLILKLKNSEGNFVAGGCIQFSEVDKPISESLFECEFKDVITEYNWEEDGSRITAMNIIRDSLFNIYIELFDGLMLPSIYNIGCDESGFDLINKNFIKGNVDTKYGFVSFDEQKLNELSASENAYIIEKAIGWQE